MIDETQSPEVIKESAPAFAALLADPPQIDRMLAETSRSAGMNPAEAAEWSKWVRERLTRDDCAILRRYTGKNALTNYLGTLLQCLLLEYRAQSR
ncbi:MAG: hypothetical protein ABI609_01795 [Acidobacteriota bacterium]